MKTCNIILVKRKRNRVLRQSDTKGIFKKATGLDAWAFSFFFFFFFYPYGYQQMRLTLLNDPATEVSVLKDYYFNIYAVFNK